MYLIPGAHLSLMTLGGASQSDSKGTWGSERASNLFKATHLGREATGIPSQVLPFPLFPAGTWGLLSRSSALAGTQQCREGFWQLLQALLLNKTEKEDLVSKPGNRKYCRRNSLAEHQQLESIAVNLLPSGSWCLQMKTQ